MDSIALDSSGSSADTSLVSIGQEIQASPVGRILRSKRSHNISLEDTMHKVKRRTISKPRKLNPATLAADVSENLIKKLYTNKKLTKLKPTNLETIFEEPKTGKNETVTYVSATRFKRSITFTDYLHVPKQMVQKRRKRVKRLLGGRNYKKMSMDAFRDHLMAIQKEYVDEIESQV